MSPLLGLGKAIEERDRVGLEASDSSSPPRDRHRSGVDPIKAKKAERKEAKHQAANTVAVLWEQDVEIEGRHLKSRPARVRQFKSDIGPMFGERPITEVTRADLRIWLDTRAMQALVRANANHRTMHRFLEFCVERDLLLVNPLARVKLPKTEVPRDRVLSAQELGATRTFLQQVHPLGDKELSLCPEAVAALIVLLTTGQRLGVVARLSLSDVVLGHGLGYLAGSVRGFQERREPHSPPQQMTVDVLKPLAEKKNDAPGTARRMARLPSPPCSGKVGHPRNGDDESRRVTTRSTTTRRRSARRWGSERRCFRLTS